MTLSAPSERACMRSANPLRAVSSCCFSSRALLLATTMDMREKSINAGTAMNARQLFLWSAAIALIALSGCGSTSNRDGANSADDAASSSSDGSSSDGATKETDQPTNDTKEMPHGPKSTNDGNSVPEDYSLTDRDCIELAKHYSVVHKADQMAGLSPKLSTAQKEQAEKAIDEAVAKLGDNWATGCRSSLVGGVVERNTLKCAMTSRTVKAFDECLNGTSAPK
jgi:hypothetical protein